MSAGGYTPLGGRKLYYGIDEGLTTGFPADFGELYISKGYVEHDKVPMLIHQAKVIQLSVLAYYKFDQDGFDTLKDSFRNQEGKFVYLDGVATAQDRPKFVQSGAAAITCDSIN
jgi:hypothetical protein